MSSYLVTVVLEEDEMEDGSKAFSVSCPELPAVTTFGFTPEEAINNAKEAVHLYFEYLHDNGDAFPLMPMEPLQPAHVVQSPAILITA